MLLNLGGRPIHRHRNYKPREFARGGTASRSVNEVGLVLKCRLLFTNSLQFKWTIMYGPPLGWKRKVRARGSLRKCIRPSVEFNAPGLDELRACPSLLTGRLL